MRQCGASATGNQSEEADGVKREEEAQGVVGGKVRCDTDLGAVGVELRPEAAAGENGEGCGCEGDEGEVGDAEVTVADSSDGRGEGEAAGVIGEEGGFGCGPSGGRESSVRLKGSDGVVEGEEGEEEEVTDYGWDEGVEEVGGGEAS
jgi:hypothetical protein